MKMILIYDQEIHPHPSDKSGCIWWIFCENYFFNGKRYANGSEANLCGMKVSIRFHLVPHSHYIVEIIDGEENLVINWRNSQTSAYKFHLTVNATSKEFADTVETFMRIVE